MYISINYENILKLNAPALSSNLKILYLLPLKGAISFLNIAWDFRSLLCIFVP
jgi:hypothetical protein